MADEACKETRTPETVGANPDGVREERAGCRATKQNRSDATTANARQSMLSKVVKTEDEASFQGNLEQAPEEVDVPIGSGEEQVKSSEEQHLATGQVVSMDFVGSKSGGDIDEPVEEDEQIKEEPNETGDPAQDNSGDEKSAQPGQKLQAKWDEMFRRLLAFKEANGHCLVPNRYAEDPQLGSWVSTQRRHYKLLKAGSGDSTPMTSERAAKLAEIGFKWATKDPRHVPWESRYKELVSFKEKYGHSQVPIGWEENVQLSNWVSTQRQEYKLVQRGRQSRLSADKISMLDKLDFIWEAQRGGPRRKRKATSVVPPKANPVDARKLQAKVASRGGKAGGMLRGGAIPRGNATGDGKSEVTHPGGAEGSESDPNNMKTEPQNHQQVPQQPQFVPQHAQFVVTNPGQMAITPGMPQPVGTPQDGMMPTAVMQPGPVPAMGMPAFQVANQQWQFIAPGGFQPNMQQGMGFPGGQFVPIAPNMQMAQPGFQFAGAPIYPGQYIQPAPPGQVPGFPPQQQIPQQQPGIAFAPAGPVVQAPPPNYQPATFQAPPGAIQIQQGPFPGPPGPYPPQQQAYFQQGPFQINQQGVLQQPTAPMQGNMVVYGHQPPVAHPNPNPMDPNNANQPQENSARGNVQGFNEGA